MFLKFLQDNKIKYDGAMLSESIENEPNVLKFPVVILSKVFAKFSIKSHVKAEATHFLFNENSKTFQQIRHATFASLVLNTIFVSILSIITYFSIDSVQENNSNLPTI